MNLFFVYILYSESFQRFYVGQTNNVEMRLARHNSGQVGSTKPYRPWNLVWFCEKPNRSEAVILENKLKNLSKARIEDFIRKYS
jgi:putative endonuclease